MGVVVVVAMRVVAMIIVVMAMVVAWVVGTMTAIVALMAIVATVVIVAIVVHFQFLWMENVSALSQIHDTFECMCDSGYDLFPQKYTNPSQYGGNNETATTPMDGNHLHKR